jgi:hypothetical protein
MSAVTPTSPVSVPVASGMPSGPQLRSMRDADLDQVLTLALDGVKPARVRFTSVTTRGRHEPGS